MLIPSHINTDCRHSIVDNGDCCCNCVFRYLLTTKDGFPIRFVCKLEFPHEDSYVINLDQYGHGLCEMHQRENECHPLNVDKLDIEIREAWKNNDTRRS